MPHTHAHEVHILLGCADARDLSQIHLDAVRHVSAEWRAKGIDVDYHTIRAAGSFVTPDVVMDIKRTIEQELRQSHDVNRPVRFFVHIQSHGHLTEDSSKEYISHVHDLHIVEGSPLNCGMLKASSLGIPLHTGDVTVERHSANLHIRALYVVRVDLPLYTVDLHFRPEAGGV